MAYLAQVWDAVNNVWQPLAGTVDTDVSYTWDNTQTFNAAIYAPTAPLGTNTDQVATTAFVLANGGGGGGFSPAISYNWTAVQTFNSSNIYASTATPIFYGGANIYDQLYVDSDGFAGPAILLFNNPVGGYPHARFYSANNDNYVTYRTTGGTYTAQTPVTNDWVNFNSIGEHIYQGWSGSAYGTGGWQAFYPNTTFSPTNYGTNYELAVKKEGTTTTYYRQVFEATAGRLSGSGLSMSGANWTPAFGPNATGWSFGTDSSFYCWYSVIGKQVFATLNIIFGSTATWGTGIPLIQLPGLGSTWGVLEAWNFGQIGSGYLVTPGNAYYKMEAISDIDGGTSSSYLRPLFLNSSGASLLAQTWTSATPTPTISGTNLRLNLQYYTLK